MPAGSATTAYSARFLAPDLIERARDNTLSCPIYSSGALVAPTSGTITIKDGSGTEIVSGAAVTVTGSVATYTISAATLPSTLPYSERWVVAWSLVIGGATYGFRNDAQLVRSALYPVVTDSDLFRRASSLDPNGASPISSLSDYQSYRDEAWAILQNRLISKGKRPTLILSPSALREVHLTLSLALIFDDLKTRLNESYSEIAQDYRDQYKAAWDDLRFLYDEDEDGVPDSARRRAASPTIWLTGR